MKYTTEEKINTFLGETIPSGSADDAILSVEQYIDNYTQRNFKADSVAVERVFTGNGKQVMTIDDCIDISKVELGSDFYGDSQTEIDSSGSNGYVLLPGNYALNNTPITEIWLKSRNWTAGLQNHTVTAKWGYSETAPADIVWVATFLSSSIYKQGQSGNIGGLASERIGEYSVGFKNEDELSDFNKATKILDSYRKIII